MRPTYRSMSSWAILKGVVISKIGAGKSSPEAGYDYASRKQFIFIQIIETRSLIVNGASLLSISNSESLRLVYHLPVVF
jgi:hypothetical protein